MSIDFSIIEKRTFDCSIEKVKDLLDFNIEDFAKKSNKIKLFEKINEKTFKIETKEKKMLNKIMMLKTVLKHKENKPKGLLYISTIDSEENNISIDCKIRTIKIDEETTDVAVKLEIKLDFGFNSITNKGIKLFADKEIKNFLNEKLDKIQEKKFFK